MTPEEKAQELIDTYTQYTPFEFEYKYAVICSILAVNQTISALNSVKGMGKIHKVKFWKKVKDVLENKKV